MTGRPPLSPGVHDNETVVPVLLETLRLDGADGNSAGITWLARGFPASVDGVFLAGNAGLPISAVESPQHRSDPCIETAQLK